MEIRKLAPGDRVLDYRILERIGEGGFGEVFRAEHELLERIVAIKVPRAQSGLTALRHEGVVQASLDHPNIVKTLELSISHDPPYVVMEYIDSDSMATLLKRGALPWKRATKILIEAAKALEFAHAKGIVHGDVKPGNILVERNRKTGRVLITDFGLGRVFEGPQGNLQISRSLELATSGKEVQGTIRYLAPELLRGETADERADIYSFAVLLFESVTGRLPEGREVPSDLMKNLPAEFDEMFASMFTRRERRPRSITPTIETLQRLLESGKKPRKAKGPAAEVVRAIPADAPEPAPAKSSARRHGKNSFGGPVIEIASSFSGMGSEASEAPAAIPVVSEALTPATPWSAKLETVRTAPGFVAWHDGFMKRIRERMGGVRGVAVSEGQGFDACFGITTEGEPHHRIYALALPKLDASTARATVAEARRIFDREKGIWEKEVTFWVVAHSVEDYDQVLWTLKSFSMGWWRRRRIVLQDLQVNRLHATELGCDPRGNPLKRAFLGAVEDTVRALPPERPRLVCTAPRRTVRGTAWGAALAMVMTFGLLGSFMALELVRTKPVEDLTPTSELTFPPVVEALESVTVMPVSAEGLAPLHEEAPLVGPALPSPVVADGAIREQEEAEEETPTQPEEPEEEAPVQPEPLPEREPESFTPEERIPDYF